MNFRQIPPKGRGLDETIKTLGGGIEVNDTVLAIDGDNGITDLLEYVAVKAAIFCAWTAKNGDIWRRMGPERDRIDFAETYPARHCGDLPSWCGGRKGPR
jgi:hypothetical protein